MLLSGQCKPTAKKGSIAKIVVIPSLPATGRPSALLDTRVVCCGDNLEQLAKLPEQCVDLVYIDPPFNSNRNYEVFWGETTEKAILRRPPCIHAGLQAYIEHTRARYVRFARVL
jgi:16S rRNA G966 N2-methylase RsmD